MEARKEDLFNIKRTQGDRFSLLRKFFTFLKKNGVKTLEESFFDEDRTQLATKFLEEISASKSSKSNSCKIKKMAKEFVIYCAEEHALISYDHVRKENANKMIQVLSEGKTARQMTIKKVKSFLFYNLTFNHFSFDRNWT